MKKLFIFDLDDTLINTTARIKVRNKRGRIVSYLGTVEHNNRTSFDDLLEKGMTLDYSEFDDLEQLKNEPKLPSFESFKHCVEKGYDVYISTARSRGDIIKEWMKDEGIELDDKFIHSCDFDTYETTAEDKAAFLSKLLDTGLYNEVTIYEDDFNNIKSYKIVLKEYHKKSIIERSYIFDTSIQK